LKLAAVDIGSNAIRFQITSVNTSQDEPVYKKLEYVRFPLRLGEDVFANKEISAKKEEKFLKLMTAFKLLFDLYEVDDYMICATSAMRESINGQEIAKRVLNELDLRIDIIDGETEAELINNVILKNLDDKNYLHIDVGGGSTELNVYINHKKVASNSYKIGSVRRLGGKDAPEVWSDMEKWIKSNIPNHVKPIMSIGTGGNIGKLFELVGKKNKTTASFKQIEKVREELNKYTVEERINLLMLNPDRADVIVPAADIYLSAMKWAHSTQIMVPEVGLKDGIIQLLFEKNMVKL
jgi:exopolyphosphatase/guanosine-5'-triphosphate,3'-diphosphate pyrophosphatase